MLYLITLEGIENVIAGPPEQVIPLVEDVVLPSLKMLVNLEREKKLTGGAFAGQRAGAFVMDFPSHEEVGTFLMSMPWWAVHEWQVTPLQSWQSQLDSAQKILQGMKASLKK